MINPSALFFGQNEAVGVIGTLKWWRDGVK